MRLKELYKKEITPRLIEKFGYKNIMQVPCATKVVINVGVGKHNKEKEYIKAVQNNLEKISGQKAIQTKARKSVSAFKIRQGMIIGVAVTLRGDRMYDFIEKLINITFPRIRDFRGISPKNIDKKGNINIGFKEHLAFPEIKIDDIENTHGVEISIATTAQTKEEGLMLFELMGFPFKKDNK